MKCILLGICIRASKSLLCTRGVIGLEITANIAGAHCAIHPDKYRSLIGLQGPNGVARLKFCGQNLSRISFLELANLPGFNLLGIYF